MSNKSLGQVAYEKLNLSLPEDTTRIPWEDVDVRTQGAWEAAAEASVLASVDAKRTSDASPNRGPILGGPVEMRDYDYIELAVEHRIEAAPNAIAFATGLSAGTRLHMVRPEPGTIGVTYENGVACKAGDWSGTT